MELEDPFVYEKPEFLKEIEREKRRAARSKRLGRPIGTWGGKRKGAGTKKTKDYTHEVRLNLSRIQVQILEDMGKGVLKDGIQALINEQT
jgi:hypothetical protein